MLLTDDTAERVLRMTQHALRSAGIAGVAAALVNENLIGDDDPRCEGYVQLDGGIDIYPTLVGDRVGWGVSTTVCIPGCRTMPNGDPGYPDDYDAVDILSPSFETVGILGPHTHARSSWSAVHSAVMCMVEQRLKNCLPEDGDIFSEGKSDA